ncbi:MAG: hypothetical protein HY051_01440 [Candidatus Aenigmarchaeota archaeon]|nr:hypothetical protein [Candidatus Aenigmarchaeota archaeon]
MEGFGSTARLFNDSHMFNNMIPGSDGEAATIVPNAQQEKILDMLYVDLGLTRVRTQAEGAIEPVNDNNDPKITDLSKYNFNFRRVDGLANHVRRLINRGVATYFFSPLKPETWMNTGNPEEYAEWAMAIVKRYRELGVEMPYYSIMNEPGLLTDTKQANIPGTYIRDVIKLLGPKLRAEGFATKIVISDDVNPCEAYKRIDTVLQDEQARQYVGALAYHLYDYGDCKLQVGGMVKDSPGIKKLIKGMSVQYGVPVWMTEFYVPDGFQWANLVHDLISDYGASAVDYMWGFFGEWDNTRSPISSLVTLKNSGAQYLGYDIQKQYYAMGQYSRYVKPGAVRVDAQSNIAGVKVTAFKDTANNRFIVVVINNNTGDASVSFKLDNIDTAAFSTVYRTSETENWVSLPSVAVSNSAFTTTLKGKSVNTFVGQLR